MGIHVFITERSKNCITMFKNRNTSKFPLTLSKYVINFGRTELIVPLFEELVDEIYIFNPNEVEYAFKILYPEHQYTSVIEPIRAILGPHSGVTLSVSLKMLCTTREYLPIRIICDEGESVDEANPSSTLNIPIGVIPEESPIVDIETIEEMDVIKSTNSSIVSTATFNGMTVVTKHFKIDWSPEAREMFAKAASTLSTLQCPQLIKVLGATVAPERECLIIEYANHGNIASCYRREALTNRWIKKAMDDVMKAIEFLHSNNRVHGDIKPQNLLVTSINEDSPVVCKLSDYWDIKAITGISSDVITDDEMISIAIFKPPEVLKGYAPTTASDIYSLGMCMLEVFQQHEIYQDKPFANGWDAAVKVAKGKRPTFDEGFNPEIADIIKRCWQQDSEERPTIQEVRDLLTHITFN